MNECFGDFRHTKIRRPRGIQSAWLRWLCYAPSSTAWRFNLRKLASVARHNIYRVLIINKHMALSIRAISTSLTSENLGGSPQHTGNGHLNFALGKVSLENRPTLEFDNFYRPENQHFYSRDPYLSRVPLRAHRRARARQHGAPHHRPRGQPRPARARRPRPRRPGPPASHLGTGLDVRRERRRRRPRRVPPSLLQLRDPSKPRCIAFPMSATARMEETPASWSFVLIGFAWASWRSYSHRATVVTQNLAPITTAAAPHPLQTFALSLSKLSTHLCHRPRFSCVASHIFACPFRLGEGGPQGDLPDAISELVLMTTAGSQPGDDEDHDLMMRVPV